MTLDPGPGTVAYDAARFRRAVRELGAELGRAVLTPRVERVLLALDRRLRSAGARLRPKRRPCA